MKKIFSVLLLLPTFGFAQEADPLASATSEATAIIYNNPGSSSGGGGIPRQFSPAMPAGPSTYVIPGPGSSGMSKESQSVPLAKRWSVEQINQMAKGDGVGLSDILFPVKHLAREKRVFFVRYQKGKVKDKGFVEFMDYNPGKLAFIQDAVIQDQILGEVTVKGLPLWPESRFQAEGAKECKKQTGANRVAMFVKVIMASKTQTSIKGLSLGGASVNGSNDVALGSALGYGKGTSITSPEDWPEYSFYCMNDGPIEGPKPPPEKEVEIVSAPSQPAEPEVNPWEEVAKALIANMSKPEPQPLPTPTVAQAVAEPVAVRESVEECNLPPLEVFFDFDKSDIKSEYLSEIKNFAERSKSACLLQVEGHACSAGSPEYNAVLARSRAKKVYNQLVEFGAENMKQFVSLSEDKSRSEHNPQDRRVIVRVVGQSSAGE
jgi:outer membrane protein OmpA-like peptidoglycan-associated protein